MDGQRDGQTDRQRGRETDVTFNLLRELVYTVTMRWTVSQIMSDLVNTSKLENNKAPPPLPDLWQDIVPVNNLNGTHVRNLINQVDYNSSAGFLHTIGWRCLRDGWTSGIYTIEKLVRSCHVFTTSAVLHCVAKTTKRYRPTSMKWIFNTHWIMFSETCRLPGSENSRCRTSPDPEQFSDTRVQLRHCNRKKHTNYVLQLIT